MFWFICLFLASFIQSAKAAEIDLSIYESSLYSPNGEDGVLSRLFALFRPTTRCCVECGAYDGITNSLTYLLRNQGWKALLLDKVYEIPALDLHKEFIIANNVNDLFEKYSVPETLDLLVFDTGYNDFYLWQALDDRYRPMVVCIAYNAHHTPTEDKIVLHHPFYCGDDTDYFGASILALYHLGKSKGYALIYAEEAGRHLFFLREDILELYSSTFKNMNDVEKLYRPPEYENGQGGPRSDPKKRPYISSAEVIRK